MSDEYWEEPPLQPPVAPHTQPSDEPEHPAAVLWVPDPEQVSGWREFYIRRAKIKAQRERPWGYAGMKRRTG